MQTWKVVPLLVVFIGGFSLLTQARQVHAPSDLLHAAAACQIDAHAFYMEIADTLPARQGAAVQRLATQAARQWPHAEVVTIPLPATDTVRVTLSVVCPPDARQAEHIVQGLRMLMGERATLSICLTGRTHSADMAQTAERALAQLEDAPQEALRDAQLVSMTGSRNQVALRGDGEGVMVFLAQPLIPMDY